MTTDTRPDQITATLQNLASLAKRFLDNADDTCHQAASAAAQALSAANTCREFLECSHEMTPQSISTSMNRRENPAACSQQGKANVLKAKALSCQPLARRNASLAHRFSTLAAEAAVNASTVASTLPADSSWDQARADAQLAQNRAAEALRHATRAQSYADQLDDQLDNIATT